MSKRVIQFRVEEAVFKALCDSEDYLEVDSPNSVARTIINKYFKDKGINVTDPHLKILELKKKLEVYEERELKKGVTVRSTES